MKGEMWHVMSFVDRGGFVVDNFITLLPLNIFDNFQ